MSLTKEDFSQLRLVIRDEVRPIVREEVRFIIREEVRVIVRDEVRLVVREEVRPIIHEEVESVVEAKLEPIRGEIEALRNDVKELYAIVGNLEKMFSHHRRIVHKTPC